ncbi:YcaO-like family protein [Modestobacter sp. VKM Ac-2977]|uniref:YcaO-like family protein n=1 Tax=Modestobacter sp. VKM Ac-2977 TaxID=3004131 RepID=UPI0022AA985F|nr:YcaO-like family protein [Modestobacter sp. VKM Ac-2977]MCZ2819827.1 YcaO-like family protein [Modestobacter sp. VKM Ac-2977]
MSDAMTVTDVPPVNSTRADGGSRPLLRRDVLIGQTGQGAFLRTADDAFALKGSSVYRWIVTLAPALDGTRTVAELSGGLSDGQARMVLQLVQALFDRGFARDAAVALPSSLDAEVLDRYRTQIRYVQHFVDDAPGRFEQFVLTRTLVLGSGAFAQAVAETLVQNGAARVDLVGVAPESPSAGTTWLSDEQAMDHLGDYDVVVAATEDSSLQRIDQLARLTQQLDFQLLPVIAVGGRAYVGPVVEPGPGPGWASYLHSVSGNLEPAEAAALWQAVAGADPVGDRGLGSPQLAAMLGGMIGFEVFRLRTGCLPAETQGGVVVQNLLTLDSTVEGLAPHPADPLVPAPVGTVDVAWLRGELDGVDRGHDGSDTAAERAEAEGYVDMIRPYTGFLREFVDLPIDQSPLKVGRLEVSNIRTSRGGAPTRVVVSDFDVHTPLKARTRAVLRAALAHVDTWGMQPHRVLDQIPEVPVPAFATWTGTATGGGSGYAVPAVDLVTGESTTVPAEVVHPLSRANARGAVESSPAGSGAGTTLPDAVVAALLSSVTHRALRAVAAGRGPVAQVDVHRPGGGDLLQFLLSSAGHLDLDLRVLDISLDGLGSTVLAHVVRVGGEPAWTAATDTSLERALVVALRELVGREQLRRAVDDHDVDHTPPLVQDLDPRRLVPTAPGVALDDATSSCAVSELLAGLSTTGQVLVTVTTTPDLSGAGIHTARVMVADGVPGS